MSQKITKPATPENNPLLKKLDQLTSLAKQTNRYDYNRIMSEIEFGLSLNQKKSEFERIKERKHRKEENKLKHMSEIREKLMAEKVAKINKKRNNNYTNLTTLPSIKRNQSYTNDAIKQVQEEEDNFRYETYDIIEERLQKFSHNNKAHLKSLQRKYKQLNLKTEESVENYHMSNELDMQKKREEYIGKKLKQTEDAGMYKQYILPKRTENLKKKRNKIKQKVWDNLKELKHGEEEKKRKYLVPHNMPRQLGRDKSKTIEQLQKKQHAFSDGFTENQIKNYQKKLARNEEILDYEYDIFNMVISAENQDMLKRSKAQGERLKTQSELEKKYNEMERSMKGISNNSIIKLNNNERMKLFLSKLEDERKRGEMEKEAQKNCNTIEMGNEKPGK